MPTIISSDGLDPRAKIEVKFEGVTNIGHLHIGDVITQVQPSQIDPSEKVPYLIVEIDQTGIEETLSKIVALINVRLGEDQKKLPFTPPIDYSICKDSNKLLLFGISGCGKTRCICEILKEKMKSEHLNRVIVICTSSEMVPDGSSTIYELIGSIMRTGDLLVWDNFPDGYVNGQNIQLGYNKIDQITSPNIKNLLMSVNSDYLQDYWEKINELKEVQSYKVAYGQDEIRKIIEDYGRNISEFSDIYDQFMEKVMAKISWIIYNKEPTPAAIHLFYQHLSKKVIEQDFNDSDVVMLADELESTSQYYKKQFKMLSNKRQYSRIYFLCTLNLCYELGLERTRRFVARLQKEIFDSDIPENPLIDLATWIEFSSGRYYSLTDIAKKAINYPLDRKPEIMDYISSNFNRILSPSETTNYLFGSFFGKNIEAVVTDKPDLFLPSHIYEYMKNQRIFASGVADGLGEVFLSIEDESLQYKLVDIADMDNDQAKDFSSFPVRFGTHLGTKVSSLNAQLRNKLLGLIESDKSFAKGISFGIGLNFNNLEKVLQDLILDKINTGTNLNLQIGFSNGIRYVFTKADKELQNFILDKINENILFCIILGSSLGLILFSQSDSAAIRNTLIKRNNWISWGLGQRYGTLLDEGDDCLLNDIWHIAEANDRFYDGLCYGIASSVSSLSERMKNLLWNKIIESKSLSECLGFYLAENFSTIDAKVQDEIFEHADDSVFACTFISRLGYLYNSQTSETKVKIWRSIEKNEKLEYHFGFFLASNFVNTKFKNLEKDLQQKIRSHVTKSKYFALGLNRGLAHYPPQGSTTT